MQYQRDWLNDDSRLKFWEKSRRIGATYVESWDTLKWSAKTGRDSWFSSADDSAAKEFIEYIKEWCELLDDVSGYLYDERLIDSEKNITSYTVRLPNGAKITAMSSNPNRFRSKGGRVIWDEAAHHKDGKAMWKALQASAMWGDPIRVLSTHMGTNSVFNQLIEKIKAEKAKGTIHATSIIDAVKDGILDRIRKRETTEAERIEWLQDLKDECLDDDQWNQEYLAIATDDSHSFLSYEMIAGIENTNVLWPSGWEDRVLGDLYLGMDIARKKHLSIIWITEKIGNMKFTRVVKEMEKWKFRDQKAELYRYLRHPQMRRACIDATGLGMNLAEDASIDFGEFKVEEVGFTAPMKEELAYSLYTEVEDKTTIIPSSRVIREDLRSVKKIVTKAKNIRFDAEADEHGHADRFWALALSNHASKTYKGIPQVASSGGNKADSILQNFEYGSYDRF